MVTWRYQKPMGFADDGTPLLYGVGDCLSTDTKPTTGLYNGSTLTEMDTKIVRKFDAETVEWREAPASQNVATTDDVEEVLDDANT